MDIHSAAYRQFLASFNGGRDWADFLDYDGYTNSSPDEQAELQQMLISALAKGSDRRIPRAIAALLPRPLALRVLQENLGNGDPETANSLLELATRLALDALYAVAKDEHADVAKRQAAVVAMNQVSWPETTVFLARLVDDGALGKQVADLLYSRLGLRELAGSPTSWAKGLRAALSCAVPAVAARGRAELRRIAENGGAINAGLTSVELTLTSNQEALLRGSLPGTLEAPKDLLTRMALEAALVRQLPVARERVVALLATIGSDDVL